MDDNRSSCCTRGVERQVSPCAAGQLAGLSCVESWQHEVILPLTYTGAVNIRASTVHGRGRCEQSKCAIPSIFEGCWSLVPHINGSFSSEHFCL